MLNPDQRRYFGEMFGTDGDSDFLNPQNIASAATRTFYLPIPIPGVDSRSPLHLEKISGDLVLRLTSRAAKESGSGTLTLNTARLWLLEEEMVKGYSFNSVGDLF